MNPYAVVGWMLVPLIAMGYVVVLLALALDLRGIWRQWR